MKKLIRVCLIGAGRIGFKLERDKKRLKPATHFGMWSKNKKANFLAIAEKKKINNEFRSFIPKSINIYSDFKKMISVEKPEIVSIATWKDSHYNITSKCIDLGIKTIVLEKPLANNIYQASELHKKIKKNNVKILINHRRRFDEKVIKLRKQLRNNIIGDILQVSAYYVYGILTTGTHLIDTLRMLLKDVAGEINYVIGLKNEFNNFSPADDQNIDGVLIFKNNLKATIQCLNMKNYDNFDIYIYGTKGKILITDIGRSGFLYKVSNSPEHEGFNELSSQKISLFGPSPRNQFGHLANNAIDCANNKEAKSFCDSYESLVDMIVIDSLIKSSKNNGKIKKVLLPNN